jgi:hypothetical protein
MGLRLALILVALAWLEPACSSAAGAGAAPTPAPSNHRLLLTYHFYWYDSETGGHLQPDVMRDHFPPVPAPDWRSISWEEKQLSDMSDAGIDGALAVYWGFDRPQDAWSQQGLTILGDAFHALRAQGKPSPHIGMFFDTSTVGMRDLTSDIGKQWFYSNFKHFFSAVPRDAWQLVNGRPVAFLFTSDFTAAFNQATFDYVYQHFQADFGVRPYIVREVSWDHPFDSWINGVRNWNNKTAIVTDSNYLWAASIHGFVNRGGVAAVGPGFDDTLVPGRGGTVVDRQNGSFYQQAFNAAIASKKSIIAIETWDEMHEGSGICDSTEFGRQYIELTRAAADRFHSGG